MASDGASVVVEKGGVIRLPEDVLERAQLAEGSVVAVTVEDDGAVTIAAEAAEPPGWTEGALEALEEVAAGKAEFFATDEEFRRALLDRMQPG